jgi:hypothetical protein
MTNAGVGVPPSGGVTGRPVGDPVVGPLTGGVSGRPAEDAPGTTAPPPAPGSPESDEGARALLRRVLDEVGLGVLGDWAWARQLEGWSEAQIWLEMRNQPEYKARYPYMDALRKKGRAISEGDAIKLEKTYAELGRQYGLPVGFYDTPDDFTALISGEVSPAEYSSRLQQDQALVFDTDPTVRQELERVYGVTDGDILANWIDPERSLPFLTQRFGAVQSAAASQRSGYGELTQAEAELLANIDPAQAAQGFGQLVSLAEVTGRLPGENMGIDRESALSATFQGNENARRRIEDRARKRRAVFEAGGQFSSSQGGVSGIGSA